MSVVREGYLARFQIYIPGLEPQRTSGISENFTICVLFVISKGQFTQKTEGRNENGNKRPSTRGRNTFDKDSLNRSYYSYLSGADV